MKIFFTLSALLVLFLFNLHCELTKSCTVVGCTDGASGRKTLLVTPKELATSVVTICRNDVCSTGKPVLTPCPGCISDSLDAQLTGPLPTSVFFLPNDPLRFDPEFDASVAVVTDATTSIDFVFRINSGPVADGDTYVVTIAQAGAAPIMSLRKTVAYSFEQPNGADCDGNYGCKVATLD